MAVCIIPNFKEKSTKKTTKKDMPMPFSWDSIMRDCSRAVKLKMWDSVWQGDRAVQVVMGIDMTYRRNQDLINVVAVDKKVLRRPGPVVFRQDLPPAAVIITPRIGCLRIDLLYSPAEAVVWSCYLLFIRVRLSQGVGNLAMGRSHAQYRRLFRSGTCRSPQH
jgi:hypothetical protein